MAHTPLAMCFIVAWIDSTLVTVLDRISAIRVVAVTLNILASSIGPSREAGTSCVITVRSQDTTSVNVDVC